MLKSSFLLVIAGCFFLTGCHRSSSDVWEDTKTCGRYMGKGFRSLVGRQRDRGEYLHLSQKNSKTPFLSLSDEDSYEKMTFEEVESSGTPLKNAAAQFAALSIEQFTTPKGSLAKLFQNIHFETDSYSIKDDENSDILHNIADYLHSHPDTYVYVEGHADERGAAAYNLALGSKRANAVRTFLIQNGALPSQLLTISYGKERPLAMNHDQNSWKINRRAQFKIYEQ